MDHAAKKREEEGDPKVSFDRFQVQLTGGLKLYFFGCSLRHPTAAIRNCIDRTCHPSLYNIIKSRLSMRLGSSSGAIIGDARHLVSRATACITKLAMAQTARWASSKRGGSSSRYLQRQNSDVYVKQRARPINPKQVSTSQDYREEDDLGALTGFVARSAFKLLQLDDRYKFLRPGRVIVDLGAAPGGWSQAIVGRTRKRASAGDKEGGRQMPVFALDLLPVVGIDGVTSIQGDFLNVATQDRLRAIVRNAAIGGSSGEDGTDKSQGFVDVIVSDMMEAIFQVQASDNRDMKLECE
uniref:rRNA methyltransferase 2, mitochondrial n=1 Tax=Melanopsichium pennsylvanicum 4 TaxID=1398559 RepID=A0A077QZE7_9BASI|nr:23s rrna methyltransferase [Melanopsichium pennsylvanicum 4]